jgi:hypothetical protein
LAIKAALVEQRLLNSVVPRIAAGAESRLTVWYPSDAKNRSAVVVSK